MIKTIPISISQENLESKRYLLLKEAIERAAKKLNETISFTKEFIESLSSVEYVSAINSFSKKLPKNLYIEDNIIVMDGYVSFYLNKIEITTEIVTKKMVMIEIPENYIERVFKFIEEEKRKEEKEQIIKRNLEIFNDYWNKNLEYIKSQIKDHEDWFMWNQIVSQEMNMWGKILKPVKQEEFDLVCSKLRGFNKEQKQFVLEYLKLIGLSDNLQ